MPRIRFSRTCDIRSAEASRPTIQRRLGTQQRFRQRHVQDDGHVRGLDAAIGEIDARRRLRGSRNADQDDVRLLDVVRELAVIMLHGEIQGLDAPEILRVERVLGADPASRRRPEIGLEDREVPVR